jgi:SAM-dependent methyltransferase
MPLSSAIRGWVRGVEEWWFDTSRGVQTSGWAKRADASRVVGVVRDSHMYGPVRARNARAALLDLPVKDFSEYTFIDVGSGRGRMLFVAAEYPFQQVLGVEYAIDLHAEAETNVKSYLVRSHHKQRCIALRPIQADAAEYQFPEEKLVLFLFNPFGPDVTNRMLDNLELSLKKCPRHVVILLVWPEFSHVFAERKWLRQVRTTRRYHVFEALE